MRPLSSVPPPRTQPPTLPHPQPPLPSRGGDGDGGRRSGLLHPAFLCVAASMAAAGFVGPFVVATEFHRLPPSAVALAVLLLAASFHVTIHLVHSSVAPCRPPAAAAAAEASATIAVAVGVGFALCVFAACRVPQEYRSAYS